MKIVCYEIRGNVTQVPVCTITFDGKRVTFKGDRKQVEFLRRGVCLGGPTIKPQQGMKYMKAVLRAYQGSYFYAEEIKGSTRPFEGAASRIAADLLAAGKYQYRHDPGHDHPPVGPGWERTPRGWRRGLQPDAPVAPQQPAAPTRQEAPPESSLEENAPWKTRRGEIDRRLKKDERESWEKIGGGHINPVWFETYDDDSKGVVKPVTGSSDPSSVRRKRDGYEWDDSVKQSQREVVAFELDDFLKLGVVPPTVWAKKTLPDGSVDDCSVQHHAIGRHMAGMWGDSFKVARRGLEKTAVFDLISGATDRHSNNCLINDEQVIAIDNGLSFPDKTKKIRSAPACNILGGYYDNEMVPVNVAIKGLAEKVSPDIIDHLSKVPESKFRAFFKSRRLENAGKAAWDRMQKLIQAAGGKKREPAPVPAPAPAPVPEPKPEPPLEHIEAYQALKRDDDPETEEKKIRDFLVNVVRWNESEVADPSPGTVDRIKNSLSNLKKKPSFDLDAVAGYAERDDDARVAWRHGATVRRVPDPDAQKIAAAYFKQAKKLLLKNNDYLDRPAAPAPEPPPVVKSVPPPPKSPVLPEAPRRVKDWRQVKTPSRFEVVSCRIAVDKVAGEVLDE